MYKNDDLFPAIVLNAESNVSFHVRGLDPKVCYYAKPRGKLMKNIRANNISKYKLVMIRERIGYKNQAIIYTVIKPQSELYLKLTKNINWEEYGEDHPCNLEKNIDFL